MVEEIKSAEKVADPTMVLGAPPKHTEEGHENCCYYLSSVVSESGGHGGGTSRTTIQCQHEQEATGGFYSEDLWLPLKEAVHRVLNYIDNNAKPPEKWVKQLREMTK